LEPEMLESRQGQIIA